MVEEEKGEAGGRKQGTRGSSAIETSSKHLCSRCAKSMKRVCSCSLSKSARSRSVMVSSDDVMYCWAGTSIFASLFPVKFVEWQAGRRQTRRETEGLGGRR